MCYHDSQVRHKHMHKKKYSFLLQVKERDTVQLLTVEQFYHLKTIPFHYMIKCKCYTRIKKRNDSTKQKRNSTKTIIYRKMRYDSVENTFE